MLQQVCLTVLEQLGDVPEFVFDPNESIDDIQIKPDFAPGWGIGLPILRSSIGGGKLRNEGRPGTRCRWRDFGQLNAGN